MKTFFKIAITSVVLTLLCVNVVAQNKNHSNSITSVSHGLTLSKGSDELAPGEIGYYTITVLQGYQNPILIYNGTSININTEVVTNAFIAKIIILSGQYVVKVTAFSDVKSSVVDTVYVKATQIYDEYGRSTTQTLGVPLVITVNPYKAKE